MTRLLNRPGMGNSALLLATRLILVPVVGGALVLAWQSPQPGKYLVLAFDVVFAGALVPLILGLFWSKANAPAALVSLFVGSGKSPGYLLYGIVDYVPPEDDVVLGQDLKGYTPPSAPPSAARA